MGDLPSREREGGVGGNVSQVTAWLVGSGAYEGFTYYLSARGTNPMRVDGIIFRGSPPAP
jgi:hypothetical protein